MISITLLLLTITPAQNLSASAFADRKDASLELYSEQDADDLWFCCVKINKSNYEYWDKNSEKRVTNVRQLQCINEHSEQYERRKVTIYRSTLDALRIFGNTLYMWGECDVWVAFACNSPPLDSGQPSIEEDLEMCMAISTSADRPFTHHAGIHRCVENQHQHKNLANKLHNFSAQSMLSAYPGKIWMVTAPSSKMLEILIRSIPKEHIFIGATNPLSPLYSSENSFIIKDRDGATITESHDKSLNQYYWGFSLIMRDSGNQTVIVVDLQVLANLTIA